MRAGRDAPAGTLASSYDGATCWYTFIKLSGARFGSLLQIRSDHGEAEHVDEGWIGDGEVIRWIPNRVTQGTYRC